MNNTTSENLTNKLVLVDVRKEYGEERAYPANQIAEMFCKLIGTKTLSRQRLRIIKDLGYAVEASISWRL